MSHPSLRTVCGRFLAGAFALAATTTVGACVGTPELAHSVRPESALPSAVTPSAPDQILRPVAAGTGKIAFEIRWPKRTIQAIPDITNAIAFTLDSGVPVTSLKRTIVRVADEATAGITFDQVAVGDATLSAEAMARYDIVNDATASDTIVVARASKAFKVAANVQTTVPLTLTPVAVHSMRALDAELVALGDPINVTMDGVGNDVLEGRTLMSVRFFDGPTKKTTELATWDLVVLGAGRSRLTVKAPPDLGIDLPLCATINGVERCSTNKATLITSVEISPEQATLSQAVTPAATTSLAEGATFSQIFVGIAKSRGTVIDWVGRLGGPRFRKAAGGSPATGSVVPQPIQVQPGESVFQYKKEGWVEIANGTAYPNSYLDGTSGGYLVSPFEIRTPVASPAPGAPTYTSQYVGIGAGTEKIEFGFPSLSSTATITIVP
ncbi:MAG: hypothetical protein VKO21_06495 [Candidatus Sericytochromatia bacterium]|nr:hypothetical protein [Candidatus Sericytochromatia bacterium]